jgi:hypothetical protein
MTVPALVVGIDMEYFWARARCIAAPQKAVGSRREPLCVGCERRAAPYISGMLNIVVILGVIGIGVVCHMIGDDHTIYRK